MCKDRQPTEVSVQNHSTKQKRLFRFLCFGLGGVLTGLTLAFPQIGFLEWVSLIPMGVALLDLASDRTVRLRRLYAWGLFFFMSFYLTVFHWFLSMYPLEFAGITKGAAAVVVVFAWVGLSLFQAVAGALTFVLAALLFRQAPSVKFPLLRPFLFGAVWAVYEWTQTLGWWGVPWGRLALGQTRYLVGVQTASLFGSYFVSFLLVSVNFCLALWLSEFLRQPKKLRRERIFRPALVAVCIMLVFQYGAGSILYFSRGNGSEETSELRVAAVQGNISSKWDNDDADRQCREVYGEYTRLAAEAGAQVVVWPETAVTHLIWNSEKSSWYRFCSDLAKDNEIMLLVGAFSAKDSGEYNSIFCFLPDGSLHETVYHKRRLVPFGEFVPFENLIRTLVPPLADLVLSGSELEAGKEASVFKTEVGNLASLICFDSIYDALTYQSVADGAEIFCLSTNDSWFGSSRALYMHAAQAQLRAVESGRWVLRSANTGLTVLIDSHGAITESIPIQEEGFLMGTAEIRSDDTLYMQIGNVFVYLCLGFLCGFLGTEACRRISEARKKRDEKNKIALDKM